VGGGYFNEAMSYGSAVVAGSTNIISPVGRPLLSGLEEEILPKEMILVSWVGT